MKEIELTRSFILTRVVVSFCVVPALRLIWTVNTYKQLPESYLSRCFKYVELFDATQFRFIQKHGYLNE